MKPIDITSAALSLRSELGLGDEDPVPQIVSVVEEELGYKYHEDDFMDDFSGYSLIISEVDAVIGFNARHFHNSGFHRFTIAHELGHLTMGEHRQQLGHARHFSKAEFRSNESLEREADQFAACFLAPPRGVVSISQAHDFNRSGVHALADHFNMSFYSAAVRFVECTSIPCVLIEVNDSGHVVRDSRSRRFHEAHYPEQIRGNAVSAYTVTADVLSDREGTDDEVDLIEWYPNIDATELRCIESVVPLGYGGRILALLTVLDPAL